MNKGLIQRIGNEIRELLIEEFPDSPSLERQCKRASILFAEVCKKLDIQVSIFSGYISNPGEAVDRERGHIWNVIQYGDDTWLVDLTLSQFSPYLGRDVADVFATSASNKEDTYMYVSDGWDEYMYHHGDVRYTLMAKAFGIAERIQNEQ